MDIISSLLTIVVVFLAVLILDYIWLGYTINKFIAKEFGKLVVLRKDGSPEVNKGVGILTWVILAIGIYFFVVSSYNTLVDVAMMGALFGFVVYGVYDLTNLTFIKKYPQKFAIIDIVWGTFISMIASIVGFYFLGFL